MWPNFGLSWSIYIYIYIYAQTHTEEIRDKSKI